MILGGEEGKEIAFFLCSKFHFIQISAVILVCFFLTTKKQNKNIFSSKTEKNKENFVFNCQYLLKKSVLMQTNFTANFQPVLLFSWELPQSQYCKSYLKVKENKNNAFQCHFMLQFHNKYMLIS